MTTKVVTIDTDTLERATAWAAERYANAWAPPRSELLGALIRLGCQLSPGPAPQRNRPGTKARIELAATAKAFSHARQHGGTTGRSASWLLDQGLAHAALHYEPIVDELKP